MSKFADQTGREWTLAVDVNCIRRVREATGYDLAKLFTEKGLADLRDDVVLLVDVLWAMVQPQAVSRAVDAREFAGGLVGDAIESATSAMLEASIDFLPQAQRAVMRAMLGKTAAAMESMQAAAMAAVEAVDVEAISGKVRESSGSRWRS